jgi:hypothetical protein
MTPAPRVYSSEPRTNRPERRGLSNRLPIEAAKRLVPVVDLADLLCGAGQLRKVGAEWVGRCPLRGHADRTPSFTVNPDKNLFFCHGCVRGGDVVRLAALAWDIDRADVAAAELLTEFGHPIPPRPASWYARQLRQQPVRAALERAKIRRVQRRLYRWIFAPVVARFEDEAERAEEERIAWDECRHIAYLLVQRSKSKEAA